MKKRLKIGLFGFGCVGQGLVKALNEAGNLETEISRICIRNPEKNRTLPSRHFTVSREELFQDPEIDVIAELTDDAGAAWEIAREALRHGKHVVTANKRMVAEKLDDLRALQNKYDRAVLYEGAVCGSIPIIRNLEQYYDNQPIARVEGIVNGSTNYILTKVSEESKSVEDALREAQLNGFAESDPRLDMEAFDPSYKLSILIKHAFGVSVKPDEIIRIGINRLTETDLEYARRHRFRIKLVAGAYRLGSDVVAWVAPRFVAQGQPLFGIRKEFNALSVEGLFAEEQLFVGRGAGGNPTGLAVLSDLSALRHGYQYAYRKSSQNDLPRYSRSATIGVVVSCGPSAPISPLDFVQFNGGTRSRESHRLEGLITLETLANWSRRNDLSVVLAAGAEPRPLKGAKPQELEAA